MAYTIWVAVCTLSSQHQRHTHSGPRPIAANFSWAYTYEVRSRSLVFPLENVSDRTSSAIDVRSNAKSVTGICLRSYTTSRTRPLSSNSLYADRCTRSAFIEILFFVWCTLIAQVILNVRYEVILRSICLDRHCAWLSLRGVIGYMLSR